MTPNERFKGHFYFLDQLEEAIAAALKNYSDAEESDLEELRHLQREVGMARRSLVELCEKFASPIAAAEAGGQDVDVAQDRAASGISATGA